MLQSADTNICIVVVIAGQTHQPPKRTKVLAIVNPDTQAVVNQDDVDKAAADKNEQSEDATAEDDASATQQLQSGSADRSRYS